jgi:hypothetical protein
LVVKDIEKPPIKLKGKKYELNLKEMLGLYAFETLLITQEIRNKM